MGCRAASKAFAMGDQRNLSRMPAAPLGTQDNRAKGHEMQWTDLQQITHSPGLRQADATRVLKTRQQATEAPRIAQHAAQAKARQWGWRAESVNGITKAG
jgi:hypothetical protein